MPAEGGRPVVLAADHGMHRKPAIEQQTSRGSPDHPEAVVVHCEDSPRLHAYR
jgi:hypothetical protein